MEVMECPECYGKGVIVETYYEEFDRQEVCDRCGGMGSVLVQDTPGIYEDLDD